MRILKISDAWAWTAEADNLVRAAVELRARGHAVTLCCTAGTALERTAREARLDVRTVGGLRARGNPISFAGAILGVRRLVRELDPDVVHAYRSPPHLIAALALPRGHRAALVRTRGTMDAPKSSPFNRALYGTRTEATIVTAEVVRAQCIEAGFDPARIEVVYGAIDLTRFDPAAHPREAARAALGLSAETPVLVHLARLSPIKGHEYLLEAMKAVVASRPDARLLIVGPAWPGMRDKVGAMVLARQLSGQVTITGELPDVPRVLAAADIGVVASVGSEALSRAALEYMAMKLPVVATRVGSVPELVEDGVCGTIVPPCDPRALAGALLELLGDAKRREAFGAAGRARVEARFGTHAMAGRLEAIYARVTSGR